MTSELNNVSTEAVKKATGREWDEWLTILDDAGAKDWSHKQIVAFLTKHYNDSVSDWWKQSVTVAYEKARGKRVLGQTADASFQIGVQKTFPVSADALWQFMLSDHGLRLWLDGVDSLPLNPNKSFTTKKGITGEVRTIDPGKRLRLTWKKPEWGKPSTLQLYFLPTNSATTALRFHHEKLPNQSARQQFKEHWQQVLDDISGAIGSKTD